MTFRKFSADKFFDGHKFQDGHPVLITTEDGTVVDITTREEAGDSIEHHTGMLSPGFINCHCHLELSHMKGMLAEDTGLVDFVLQVVTQRHFPEEEILAAIEKAETEMLDNGIVAVGDICNNALTIQQKLKGRIWYHNFIEASGFTPAIAQQRFDRSKAFFAAFGQLYSMPVESNSIVPHAPYSVSNDLWEMIIHFPGNHLMTIHNQETAAEDKLFRTKEGEFLTLYEKMKMDVSFFEAPGKSSLQTCLQKFLPNQSVILVHNVFTIEEDILFAKHTGRTIYWCVCPNANWYISRKMPPVDLFIQHNLPIVLGTDSLASNHQLSILEEIKTLRQHYPFIETHDLLKWATSNGAKALQVDALLGSFDKQKKPGVLIIAEDISSVKRLL
jgi:cytosine/adenosine deaminase-related metal-dependent hydrolase